MNPISKTAGDTIDRVGNGARHARTSLLDFGTQVLRLVNSLGVLERNAVDSLIGRVGLQRRESGLGPVMWFATGGALVGGAILALSPRTRNELGSRLARMFEDGVDASKETLQTAEHAVEVKLEHTYDDAKKSVLSAVRKADSKVEDALKGGNEDRTGTRSNATDDPRHNSHSR